MDRSTFSCLSNTQLAVLWLTADHSRGAIAKTLGIGSVETVKTHLAAIRMRLGGVDRGEASRALRRHIREAPPWVTPPWGMGPHLLVEPPPVSPERADGELISVREHPAPFCGVPPDRPGPSDRTLRLEVRTPLAKIVLVFALALVIVMLVGSAPDYARQAGSIGRLIYHR